MTRHLTSALGLAINATSGHAPEWVQLTPPGPRIAGRDGRSWRISDPDAIIAAFKADPKRPQIDIEHASQLRAPRGEPAPAVGWIEDLELRDGAFWARVDWTEEGRNAVAGRAYRYLSPAFQFDARSGDIRRFVSAGLTNNPNLHLAALNAAQPLEGQPDMDPILEALGLNSSASAADAVLAIQKLKEARDTALNSAAQPDPDKFVPKADHELALNRIAAFEAEAETRTETAINAAVDAAIEAGKIAPASRDYHIAACRSEGGLARFAAAMDATPGLSLNRQLDKQPGEGSGASGLSDEQMAVCRQLGLDPTEFATAHAAYEKDARP